MKARLLAFYLPEYPELSVETPVGDRFKADVVASGHDHQATFRGEAGRQHLSSGQRLTPYPFGESVKEYAYCSADHLSGETGGSLLSILFASR